MATQIKKKKKLTEAEKKAKAKKLREAADAANKEAEEHEHESASDTDDGDGDADDADHPDADKDAALIKKMIADHLGDDTKDMSAEEMEALHSLGHEAYQAHKEMGKTEKEAAMHAGEALKLAHHMNKKEKETNLSNGPKEGADPDDAAAAAHGKKGKKPAPKAAPAADDSHDDDSDDDDDVEEHEDEHGHKESSREKKLKDKLLEAEGRIAALEAKTQKSEVLGYVDLKLKESKQPSSITKKFREAAGDFASKKDFDAKWKVFLAGVVPESAGLDFGALMEKSMVTEDGSRVSDKTKGLDFSKCAE